MTWDEVIGACHDCERTAWLYFTMTQDWGPLWLCAGCQCLEANCA